MHHKIYCKKLFSAIIAILLFCLQSVSAHAANSKPLCDYYDPSGSFILSFPEGTKLGRSGPSSSNGIHFLFDDGSELKIYASTSIYDPACSDPGDMGSYKDDEYYVLKYAKPDCEVIELTQPGTITEIGTSPDAPQHSAKKIICKDYTYTVIPGGSEQDSYAGCYIYILFDHKSPRYMDLYNEIVDSMLLFKGEAGAKALHIWVGAGMYDKDCYTLDDNDPYAQPFHLCRGDRIRNKLLSIQGKPRPKRSP